MVGTLTSSMHTRDVEMLCIGSLVSIMAGVSDGLGASQLVQVLGG